MGSDFAVYGTQEQFFSSVKRRMPLTITVTGRLILLQEKRSKIYGLILDFLQAV